MILYPDKTYYYCNRSKCQILIRVCQLHMGCPGSSAGKESTCNAEGPSSIPGREDPLEKVEATHSSIQGGGLDSKESACNVGDQGSIPGLGRPSGGGHGNPCQYSCLENPHGQRAWWATAHGVTKSRTRLSD